VGVPIPEGSPASGDEVDASVSSLGDRLRAGKRFSALRSDLLKTEIEADHAQYAADRENQRC
jgi:hypothetical protein